MRKLLPIYPAFDQTPSIIESWFTKENSAAYYIVIVNIVELSYKPDFKGWKNWRKDEKEKTKKEEVNEGNEESKDEMLGVKKEGRRKGWKEHTRKEDWEKEAIKEGKEGRKEKSYSNEKLRKEK